MYIQLFKNEIKPYLSNSELINIFIGNKRIRLFFKYITTFFKYERANYPLFFAPEAKRFMNEEYLSEHEYNIMGKTKKRWNGEIKIIFPENFYDLPKKGENDCAICELIPNDLVIEFIHNFHQNNLSLDATIILSRCYTNHFLLKDRNTILIEYATFLK